MERPCPNPRGEKKKRFSDFPNRPGPAALSSSPGQGDPGLYLIYLIYFLLPRPGRADLHFYWELRAKVDSSSRFWSFSERSWLRVGRKLLKAPGELPHSAGTAGVLVFPGEKSTGALASTAINLGGFWRFLKAGRRRWRCKGHLGVGGHPGDSGV